MRWLGTMLHLLYPPKVDETSRQFAALLAERQGHVAQMKESRVALEKAAGIEPIDDLAEGL